MPKSVLTATRKRASLTRFAEEAGPGVIAAIQEEGKAIKQDYEETTKSWNTEVTFEIKILASNSVKVFTLNKIYRYVNKGTPAHDITAPPGGRLFFMTPYGPKTRPNILGSGPGSIGTNLGVAQVIHHPGTEARNFSKLIAKIAKARFQKRLRAVLKNLNK
jgi:hypothetical protein